MKSEELKYITYDEALVVYTKTVAASGGGLQGVKDEGVYEKSLTLCRMICTIRHSLRS